MKLLHRIGQRINSNFNSIEEVLACDDILTFDGVYLEVYEYRHLLKGKRIILFPSGQYFGCDNSFDVGQPPGRFCTLSQVFELKRLLNAEVGWHGQSHVSLPTLSEEEIRIELTPPWSPKGTLLAYPYGNFDERVIRIAKELGYRDAYSVIQGDGSEFQRKREYLNW